MSSKRKTREIFHGFLYEAEISLCVTKVALLNYRKLTILSQA
jgi:hypothetical protein